MNQKLMLQIASVGGALVSAVCGILIAQLDNEELKVRVTQEVLDTVMNATKETTENI